MTTAALAIKKQKTIMVATQTEFSGSIPEHYHRYLVPLIFEKYGQELAKRAVASPTGSVLEVACGTGVLTRHLQAALHKAVRIVATDINPAMLEHAKTALEEREGIEYRTAD